MYFKTNYELNNIPIVEVAKKLGIAVSKFNKAMCFTGHDKKTPSLSFNLNGNYFYCFGCLISGNPIKLVMIYLGYDYKEACKWLETNFYLQPYKTKSKPYQQYKSEKHNNYQEDKTQYSSDSEIYEWIINNTQLSKKGYHYCSSIRGFTKESIDYFKIRDIENPSKYLYEIVPIWGKERLIKCGLMKLNNTEMHPTWFGHVLLFSFFNFDNKIEYIQARLINNIQRIRYINLNGIKSTIFNIITLSNISPNDKLIICEGIPDTIRVHQLGYNAIGILGATNFKQEYIKYLIDYDIYVLPDNDQGGEILFNKIDESLRSIGKNINRITYDPKFKDISDYLRNKDEISK